MTTSTTEWSHGEHASEDLTKPAGSSPLRVRDRHRWWRDVVLLLPLLTVAILPRIFLQLHAPSFVWADSNSYVRPTLDLINGLGLPTGQIRRPVGYPLFLAGTFTVFGAQLPAMTAVQHGIGVLTVALTYVLGKICFNRWVGFGAALLVAISAPQLIYEHSVLTESVLTLLLVGLAISLIRATQLRSYRPALIAGVLVGVAALVKPAAQSLLPAAVLFAALRPGTRRQRVLAATAVGLAFALTVTPWMLRNLAVHGRMSVGGTLSYSLLSSTLKFSRGTFVFDSPDLPPDPDPARQTARRLMQIGADTGATDEATEAIRDALNMNQVASDQLILDVVVRTIRRQPLDFISAIPRFAATLYGKQQRSFQTLWESHRTVEVDQAAIKRLVRSATRAQEARKGEVEALLSIYDPQRYGFVLPIVALVGLASTCVRSAGGISRGLAPAVIPGVLGIVLVIVHITLNGPVPRYRYPVEPFVNVLMLGAVWMAVSYVGRAASTQLGPLKTRLSTHLQELRRCAGLNCRTTEDKRVGG